MTTQDIGQFKSLWNRAAARKTNLDTAEGALWWAIKANRETRGGYLLREMAAAMRLVKGETSKYAGEPSLDSLKQWERLRVSKAGREPIRQPNVKAWFDRTCAQYLRAKALHDEARDAVNARLVELTDEREPKDRVRVEELAAAVGTSKPNLYKRRSTGRKAAK